MTDLGANELVEIDAENILALARVRSVDSGRLYVALEQGMFLPWTDRTVRMRRCGDDCVYDARIIHSGGSTATLQVLARVTNPEIPPPNDTERELDRWWS